MGIIGTLPHALCRAGQSPVVEAAGRWDPFNRVLGGSLRWGSLWWLPCRFKEDKSRGGCARATKKPSPISFLAGRMPSLERWGRDQGPDDDGASLGYFRSYMVNFIGCRSNLLGPRRAGRRSFSVAQSNTRSRRKCESRPPRQPYTGDWGQGGGDKGAEPAFGFNQKITRSSSSGGARPRCAASST